MDQEQQETCAGGEVEFDIFSGQPNPFLTLNESECAAIIATLRSLPEAVPFDISEQLGYRGAYISLNTIDSNQKNTHTKIYVLADRIRVEQAGVIRFLTDSERRLEAVLLGQAAGSLDPGTVNLLDEVMN